MELGEKVCKVLKDEREGKISLHADERAILCGYRASNRPGRTFYGSVESVERIVSEVSK